MKALTAVIGKDIVDYLSNLGYGLPFIEQFSFTQVHWKGSYGSVWAAPDTLSTKPA